MWSLEQAYEEYPQIEEEFSAVLDESLHPRGPDLLYDLVARLGPAPGAVALDVGLRHARQAEPPRLPAVPRWARTVAWPS